MTRTGIQLQAVPLPFTFRLLQVKRTQWLTPHMVRVTLTGDALPGFRSDGADDGARLFFPVDPTSTSWAPTVEGTNLTFPDEVMRQRGREYTPRRYDADANELDFDFVVHGDGPASTWAANAQPGHTLGVSGPRRSRLLQGTVDWYLLAGDETAIPSIGRRLEALPVGTPAIVVLAVANAAERQPFQTNATLRLTWLHADETADRDQLLANALRDLRDLPAGEVFAWAAGEASSMRQVRRHLLTERGIPAEQVRITGYWKRTIANYDHHQPLDGEP